MNTANSSAVQTSQAVERQSEVSEQMQRLQATTEYIDKIVSELEAALSQSILAQRKEGGAETATQPEPVRVPMAQALYDRAYHLETIRERLSSILSRLEA